MIPVYSPRIYTESVQKALESGWISSQGEYLEKTRALLRDKLQVPYVVLMNNGTSATHMLVKALRYKYPEIQRVYAPNHVFIAVWNTILYEFPSFEVLEMDPNTMNMRTDEEYLRSLSPNSAVVVVHNGGNIVNVPRMKRIRPDLVFVEDNCEGLFGEYEGIPSGSSPASLASAVSFFANKTITSGEGGAFMTHDAEIYDFVYRSVHHGMTGERYVYHDLGYNYRMTNLQAAILYDQLIHLDEILRDKARVLNTYRRELHDLEFLEPEEGTKPSPWMMICGANIPYPKLDASLRSKGVDIRPFFYDMHVHRHLRHIPRPELRVRTTFFMLPSHPDLSPEQQSHVVQSLREAIAE